MSAHSPPPFESLTPDTLLKTTLHVLEVEKRLGRPPRPASDEVIAPAQRSVCHASED